MSRPLRKLAVVTGGHSFDVVGFHELMSSVSSRIALPYIQHLDDLACSSAETLSAYDAALFYFFPQAGPVDDGAPWHQGRPRAAIERLLDAGIGIIVLHHALLAYPDWALWDDVVGTGGRARFSYQAGRALTIVPSPHAITSGLEPWRMVDETYCMPDPHGDPLLRTDHPASMPMIGWTRRCRGSRVVCLQSGHDAHAWSSPQFQRVLARSISWSLGAVPGGSRPDARQADSGFSEPKRPSPSADVSTSQACADASLQA